jgi:hypothetical protein
MKMILEYYIVNGGDERKWNKQTNSSCSTNVKSSLLGCLGTFRDVWGRFRMLRHI